MEYFLHLFILICFYCLLSQSLNLSAGLTGLISLAHAGFYGIGAYTSAILSTRYGISFWFSLPFGMIISGVIASVISLIALRTVEDYFIICTLGIQVILFSVMNNWLTFTRGPLGISNIPPIDILGVVLNSKISFLALSLFFVVLVWFILRNISRSGFGKTLIAISEDEIYAQSIGKNVYLSKSISFTLGAMLAAIPGSLYAHYISYVDPTSFTVNESILILSIVVIGGLGNFTGSFLASIFLVILPEILRFVGIPDSIAANMRQVIYGLILIAVMVIDRNGLKNIFNYNFKKR